MAIPLKKKETILEDISSRLSAEGSFIVVDYMGLTVSKISDIRKKMRPDGITMMVAKNTLFRRALTPVIEDETERGRVFEHLKGPSAIVFAQGDPINAARHIHDFLKTSDKPKVKCGYYDGHYIDMAGVESLSRLGSREEIVGKLIMALKAPMYKLVNALNGPMTNVVGTLKAVAEKNG